MQQSTGPVLEADASRPMEFPEADPSLVPEVRPWLARLFVWYARRKVARNFNAVRRLRGPRPDIPDDVPLVIYMNHPGWWDALVGFYLADLLFPKRTGYAPVVPWGFARYRIMQRVGLFSVNPNTLEGAVRFWRISRAILATPNAMLCLTPGGAFVDPRQRQVPLRAGLARVASAMHRGIVLPLAVEYPFWQNKHLEVLVHCGRPIRVEEHQDLDAKGWNAMLASRLEATQDVLAEHAIGREPEQFEVLLRGTSGRGRLHNALCRLRGLALGEAFRPKLGD